MSLDLPDELVWAINFIGMPEEDQLHEYAARLRTYAASIADAHTSLNCSDDAYHEESWDTGQFGRIKGWEIWGHERYRFEFPTPGEHQEGRLGPGPARA